MDSREQGGDVCSRGPGTSGSQENKRQPHVAKRPQTHPTPLESASTWFPITKPENPPYTPCPRASLRLSSHMLPLFRSITSLGTPN